MNAHSAKPEGKGGCQISRISQRNACQNKAITRRWTGKVWISLCQKHDNPVIGKTESDLGGMREAEK